jgi:hypothetical protein
MVAIIMGNIEMAKNMEKAYIIGQMVLSIQVIGKMMKCMVVENLFGQMVENTKVHSL